MRIGDITRIEIEAEVRYWEDAAINGRDDSDGSLIPFRRGNNWCPAIRIADGYIVGWPDGMQAEIHYKVCDGGNYWLTNDAGARIAKLKSEYVPDFLDTSGSGFGDYIVLNVGPDGKIEGWQHPDVSSEDLE